MLNLSVKQKIVNLAISEQTYEKIYNFSFRPRRKVEIYDHCLKALEAPLDTTPAINENPLIANQSTERNFDVKINESMDQRYEAGEQIAGYEIEITYNAEIFGKFCVQKLTDEQRAMAIDLIQKDPNYNSVLNHMVQKLYKFYLKVTHLASNQQGENKAEYAEVSFSNSKILKFKITKVENKKNVKKIVCYHALKIMFPETFELTREFISRRLNPNKAPIHQNRPISTAKETEVSHSQLHVNEKPVQQALIADDSALLLEMEKRRADFFNSFDVSLDIILFQRSEQTSNDSFMNSTGFVPFTDKNDDPVQTLNDYFRENYTSCIFELQRNLLNENTTELTAVVHSDVGRTFVLMSATINSHNRQMVDAFMVKFAKILAKHLRLNVA